MDQCERLYSQRALPRCFNKAKYGVVVAGLIRYLCGACIQKYNADSHGFEFVSHPLVWEASKSEQRLRNVEEAIARREIELDQLRSDLKYASERFAEAFGELEKAYAEARVSLGEKQDVNAV